MWEVQKRSHPARTERKPVIRVLTLILLYSGIMCCINFTSTSVLCAWIFFQGGEKRCRQGPKNELNVDIVNCVVCI